MAQCRLLIHPDTQCIPTLGVEVASSILGAAEGLVVDDMAAGGLAAPSVVVVAVVGERDLRRGGRAPARLDHDVGLELAVRDSALLIGLVSNGFKKAFYVSSEKKICDLQSSSCRSRAECR